MSKWYQLGRISCLTALLSSLLFATISVQAEDVKLPEHLVELKTPSAEQLGTVSENVGLKVGQTVPEFSTKDHFGKAASLSAMKAKAPLLFVFYRGGWCPYCNMQIRQLTEAWPEFKKRGVTPVLISADKPDAAAMATRTYEIPFPVLSDSDLIAHEAFNVVTELPEDMVASYKGWGIVLEDWNGKGHRKYAVASAFVVGKDGKVLWSHTGTYDTRPSTEQLLSVIDELKL